MSHAVHPKPLLYYANYQASEAAEEEKERGQALTVFHLKRVKKQKWRLIPVTIPEGRAVQLIAKCFLYAQCS